MFDFEKAQKQYWDHFSSMMQSFAKPEPTTKNHDHHPFHKHIDSWAKLSQHCHHLASMAALYPKSAFQPQAPKTPSYAEASTFGVFENFTLPAIGPSRESIEMLQECQPLLAEYYEAWMEYQPILMEVWFKAWKRTVDKIEESMKQEQPLTTRQIYDIGIECGEQTYADIVTTENYQKIYGRFANAAMACKNHAQDIRQEMLRSMNLPTKQDLDSAYERIQTLTRELRDAKKDIADLKQQMSEFLKDSKHVRPKK